MNDFDFIFSCQYSAVTVNVFANPGLFLLGNTSATGKTYLYTIFNESSKLFNNRVLAYTYKDFERGVVLNSENLSKYDIILLDRFDLYSEAFTKILVEASKYSAVLLDFKGQIPPKGLFVRPPKYATIDISKNSIRVVCR